jgi:predicted P-loop ATPase
LLQGDFSFAQFEKCIEQGRKSRQNRIGEHAPRSAVEVWGHLAEDGQEPTTADYEWPVINPNTNRPAARPENTEYFLKRRGVSLYRDIFSGLTYFGNGTRMAELGDDGMRRLHQDALRHGYAISKEGFLETVYDLAMRDQRHPVLMYLDGLAWDGTPRLDNWLTEYAGAADTPYVSAVGKLMLVSAVRRVRKPGCKYDYLVTFESPQGMGKSRSLPVLAGEPWFTDAVSLGDDPKEMIEQTRGKWIVEVPELGGMNRRDVEQVKAQLSRQVDRARLAYGRTTTEVPRQFILVGTNNPEKVGYLKDTTGNRRFLPVRIRKFDHDALARDRDQLWAEAALAEKTYGELALPEELWGYAAKVQESRREKDPMESRLAEAVRGVEGFVATEAIYDLLGLGERGVERRRPKHDRIIIDVMTSKGWTKDRRCPPNSDRAKMGYWKGNRNRWLVRNGAIFEPMPG